jgi:calcineurin-like phosphoesterase family protein
MDYQIISNWNDKISDKDIVYHLGDWGSPDVVTHLNGYKIFLIPGNHDTNDIVSEISKDRRVTILRQNSFYMDDGKKLFGMVHRPRSAKSRRYFYLFGHIHKLQMVKKNGLNVGVDCHNFQPVSFGQASRFKNLILNEYGEDVFMPELGYVS